jgi:hypothetical protein
MVVWFNAEAAEPGKSYLLKHTSRTVRAKALKFHYRVNVNTLAHEPSAALQMNDIAYVELETVSPLFFDPYTQNRITGSFILIDPISNATLGAGMIRADLSDQTVSGDPATAVLAPVTAVERFKRHGHAPALVVVENNASLAMRLERTLFDDHFEVLMLSEDSVSFVELEAQYSAFQSAGLVVIYSCEKLSPQAKAKLAVLTAHRFFELSPPTSSADGTAALRNLLSQIKSLRL